MEPVVVRDTTPRRSSTELMVWGTILFVWFSSLCVIPDPRPMGAPDWAVRLATGVLGISEPGARVVATLILRASGLGLFGILIALSTAPWPMKWAAPLSLVAAPILAVVSQWVNYGYFPIEEQVFIGVTSAVFGALGGLALRKSRIALAVLIVLAVGLFSWGTATGISDDLYEAAGATADHILAEADEIPDGDEGFVMLLESAFKFAADNSHRKDPVMPNEAAILALGVILGEERVADVAAREIDHSRTPEIEALRRRITLRGRNDLARHFWVSAALAVLADEDRSMAVGIAKEMMDANPGGSGFSFVDLVADRVGILFANAATKDADSAREMQELIRSGITIDDLCPDIEGLPEGISADDFQIEYGGLGGNKTNEIVEDIRARIRRCRAIQSAVNGRQ